MKSKKDKNVSVQLSLYSIFDEISKIQHINKYKDYPDVLADQIDDLKTLLHFAASNYTNKAKTILNLSKQFTKSIQTTLQGVNQLDAPLYQMPQKSFPELAFQTLKRSTNLELQEQIQQQDWRAVQTEYQLKFLQSKNISEALDWQKCYNHHQRCIQIGKYNNQYVHSSLKQSLHRPLQIDLSLKIQNCQIVWHIKKVLYHNNIHYGLLSYYQNELMLWIREQHNNIQQSQKYVLSLLHKSIDYIDIILLFIELKSAHFNQNIEQSDRKNGILNLFDQKDTMKFSYLKNKNIKICFLLPYSNFAPSMILRVDGLNVLKIQFTKNNQILLKIKLKNKQQQMTLKKLLGSIKKLKFIFETLIEVVHQVLECLQTYEKFVNNKLDQYKIDIFLTNRSTNLLLFLKSVNVMLLQQSIVSNQAINLQIKYDLSIHHILQSGIYFVFNSLLHQSLSPLITYLSPYPQLLFKTTNTQFGFINKLFKNHPSITYQEAMYHMHYLQQIQYHQDKSNWNVKLVYADIYTDQPFISYKFKLLTQRKINPQNSIVKKDIKSDFPIKDYSLHVKISQNFKSIQFIYALPILPNQVIRSDTNINGSKIDMNRYYFKPQQSQIPQKYFKSAYRQYMKKRQQSQILKNQYLDIDHLLKATHYILNHLEFNRYIKGKAGIFKNQDMIRLMDQ